jgi:hypothetical protein
VKRLTLADVVAFYREHVAADGPQRRKLGVHFLPEAMAADPATPRLAGAARIASPAAFRAGLALQPRVATLPPVYEPAAAVVSPPPARL